jgi:uncharacterized membrane protein YiaA
LNLTIITKPMTFPLKHQLLKKRGYYFFVLMIASMRLANKFCTVYDQTMMLNENIMQPQI